MSLLTSGSVKCLTSFQDVCFEYNMRDAENPLVCFLRRGGSDSPALLMKRKTAHAQKLAPRKHPAGFWKRNRKPTSSDTIPCTPFAFRKDPEGFRKKNRKGNKPRTKLASRKLPEAQPEKLRKATGMRQGCFSVSVWASLVASQASLICTSLL